ncbi:ABC transporter permease subunit [uncultured Slackia sp.]|uniref:ABC transporter permease subunit n=1 Tax=uncultured Slackia sp. TaxID=665903 RepID=UPI0025E7D08C|nr:ABC transporter permease subunit [uncultured Slackia sp.]
MVGCSSETSQDDPSASSGAASSSENQYTLVNQGKLTVASDLATPPFEYADDSGEPQGFTVELMGMIADRLGLELNYLPAQKFDGIIPSVKQGVKTDVGACNITINEERLQEVDFTDSYMDSNQGVAAAKDSGYEQASDLNQAGVKVAVQSGTTSEEWAIENLPNAQTVNFDDWIAAFTAVMSGQCQAVVCDLPVEQWMVSNSFTDMEIIEEIPTGEQFGIAVSKSNPGLTQAINRALADIRAEGAYDELYEKWFGMAPSGSGGATSDAAGEAAASDNAGAAGEASDAGEESATAGSDSADAAQASVEAQPELSSITATARSNEDGGSAVLGGIATRLTWGCVTGTEEGDISQITLQLPDGGSFEDTSVEAVIVDDLSRTQVQAQASVSDSSLVVDFAEPIPAGSQLSIEVEGVLFPSTAGAYTVGGTYTTSDGTQRELPASPTISVSESTWVQAAVNWLDSQAWVEAWNSNPFLGMFFKLQYVVTSIASLFQGWGTALLVTVIGFPLAIPVGLLFAFLKMSRNRVLRAIGVTYINLLRGIPLFLQIYIAFFGMPMLGFNLPNLPLGIAVMAVNTSAYLAEIFRAGIESIPKGQMEAASSLGMNKIQAMGLVIIPQTVRRVMPTMTSEFVMLYKDTSLLSSVGVMELMMFSKNLTATTGNITPYICAALYYLVVTIPLIHVVTKAEKKMASEEGGRQ